jgi:hypothetical protein
MVVSIGFNVLIKIMQKSFASYALEVLHYKLLVVEKTHLICNNP